MLDTPLDGYASALGRPSIAPKFTWSPVATTSASYASSRPESVRTALCAGSKDATFSGMCVMYCGIRLASGRRSADFCFRPAPTRVLLLGFWLGEKGEEEREADRTYHPGCADGR